MRELIIENSEPEILIENSLCKIGLTEDSFLSNVTKTQTFKIVHLELDTTNELNLRQLIKSTIREKGIEDTVKIDLTLPADKIKYQKFLIKQKFYHTAQNIGIEAPIEIIKKNKNKDHQKIVKIGPNELNKSMIEVIAHGGSTLYTTSRFFVDQFYDQSTAQNIFYNWISNTFEGYTDHIYLLTKNGVVKDGEVLGFASIKSNEDTKTWVLDLIAKLDEEARGVGTALMEQIYYDMIQEKVKYYKTGTQATNIGALKLYFKFGMNITNTFVLLTMVV